MIITQKVDVKQILTDLYQMQICHLDIGTREKSHFRPCLGAI